MEQQTKAPGQWLLQAFPGGTCFLTFLFLTAETRNVVNFLRSKSGMKIRTGVLNGKRVDYFKGGFHMSYCRIRAIAVKAEH